MKHKVGDKVRIKSKEWYDKNKDNYGDINIFCGFTNDMSDYCGKEAIITFAYEQFYFINIDNGNFRWTDEMFEDSLLDATEKSIITEEVIKDVANVIKSHNLGVCVSENEGKLIIEPIKVEEDEDLKKGTHVMVTNDINNEAWTLRQYLSNGYCDTFRTKSFHLPPMKFRFIIAFEKFNPNNIEESLKYNIVK